MSCPDYYPFVATLSPLHSCSCKISTDSNRPPDVQHMLQLFRSFVQSLQSNRSRDPVVGIDCRQEQDILLETVQTGSGSHPASQLVSTCVLSWEYSSRGARVPALHLVSRLRMSGDVPPLRPVWPHGADRDNFAFSLAFTLHQNGGKATSRHHHLLPLAVQFITR